MEVSFAITICACQPEAAEWRIYMEYCMQVYTGDGKGKSSASIGAAVRMAGSGGSVVMARFLKREDSAEVAILREIPNITVIPVTRTFGFTFRMTELEKVEAKKYYDELFDIAVQKSLQQKANMLILDELNCVYASNLVSTEHVLDTLQKLKGTMELVITGRNAARELLELADYVTELKKEKHPHDRGLMARKGIEY